jgi:hypothetical protein
MPVRTGLSDGNKLVANELALLRDLAVDRRQASWSALCRAQPVRKRRAASSVYPSPAARGTMAKREPIKPKGDGKTANKAGQGDRRA